MSNTVFQTPRIKVKVKSDTSLQPTNNPVTLRNAIGSLGSIAELIDVSATNPSNSDILAYNAASTRWTARAPTSVVSGNTQQILVSNTNDFTYTIRMPSEVAIGSSLSVGNGFTVANGVVTITDSLVANLTVNNATLSGDLIVHNIIPEANNTYSLGTPDLRFFELYLSGNTLVVGNVVFNDSNSTLALELPNGSPIAISTGNVTIDGSLSVAQNFVAPTLNAGVLTVTATANIAGTTTIGGNTVIAGRIAGGQGLTITGNTLLTGTTTINGPLNAGGTTIDGFANIASSLTSQTLHTGNTTINGTATVNGLIIGTDIAVASANVNGPLAAGNTTIVGTINVSSPAQFDANVSTFGDLSVRGATAISNTLIAGNTTVNGHLRVVATANVVGDVILRQTLAVNGAVTIANTLLTGNTTINGSLTTGNTTINGSIAASNATITGTANVGGVLTANTLSVRDVTVTGNLAVAGNTTFINSTQLNIGDNIITLNADLGSISPTENAGLEVNRGTLANASFLWDEVNDRWSTNGDSLAAGGAVINSTAIAIGNTVVSDTGVITAAVVATTINRNPTITVALTGDVTGTGSATLTNLANGSVSIATSIQPNSITLGTDTSGDYVASLVPGTGVFIANNGGETSTPTISIGQDVSPTAQVAFGNTTIAGHANVQGSLTTQTLAAGNTTIQGTVSQGNTTISGFANISSSATVGGALSAGNTTVTGTLSAGDTTITGFTSVSGTLSAGDTTIAGFANISGTVAGGNTTITGFANISGSIAGGNTTITGFANVSGDLQSATLSTGNASVVGTLSAGNTTVLGFANVSGELTAMTIIAGNTEITGTLAVEDTTITGFANVIGPFHSTTIESGNTTLAGSLSAGNTTIAGFANVVGHLESQTLFTGNTNIAGYVDVVSTANISGVLSARANVVVNGALIVSNTATLGNTTIEGTLATYANASVNGSISVLETVSAESLRSNTITANTISVNGAANVVGALTVRGATTVNGAVVVANTLSVGNTTVAGFVNVISSVAIAGPLTVNNSISVKDATINGNLTVTGTTTYVNTNTLNVGDNIITLNADVTGAPTENAGIEVHRGTSATVSVLWDETNDRWIATRDGTIFYEVIDRSHLANTSSAGIVYLTDSVANTTSYVAGSASSVKTAYDAAIAANTRAASAQTAAAAAYTNAASYADTKAGQAYSNAASYADTKAATAYSNATSYADTKANEAYSNAASHADTKASEAYSNAVSYTDTKSTAAYSNAVTFAANADNISSGTVANARLNAASTTSAGIVQLVDATDNTSITIAATANSVKTAYDLAVTANAGLATGYSNAVSYANNAAITAYTNAVSTAASDATTKADAAYTNAVSFATTVAGNAYANATSYADTKASEAFSNSVTYTDSVATATLSSAQTYADNKAANAYSNAVSYTDIKSGNAYSNAVSYADIKAANAYSNAVSYTDGVATTTYNNATAYADIKAGQAYTNAIAIAANASNITSGTLDTARLPSTISIGNSSVNTTISGTTVATRQTDFKPATPATIGSWQEGRMYYDSEEKTIVVHGAGTGNVELTLGQREWVRCRNASGALIPKGKPVYTTGVHIPGDPTHGHHPTIALADASDMMKTEVIGVTGEDIADGAHGYVIVRGYLEGIDTSALTAGQTVHLGYASPGDLVTAAPTYPNYPFEIGKCLTSNSTVGTLYINLLNQTFDQFRVTTAAYFQGSLTVDGDFNITGNVNSSAINNLSVKDNFIYIAGGDAIAPADTTFTGTGLDDLTFRGNFEGTSSTHYYVKIDGTSPDTFAWSKDNFATTEATGVTITGDVQDLDNGIGVEFGATTGHTLNDKWDGVAAPVNVDVGWVGNYNDGTYAHTGFFRDASDGVYKLFQGYTPEPSSGANINTSDPSFQLASLSANVFYGNVVGSVTGTVTSAAYLTTGRKIQLTGDVSGNVVFDGTANVQIATSIGTLNTSLTIANTLAAGNTTITGRLSVSGNTTINGNTLYVGNTLFVDTTQERVGIATATPTAPLTVGEGGATLTTPAIQVTDTQDSYIQVALQNLSNGEFASSDFVLTADNGTDLTNYVDLGISSSGFNYPDFNIIQPLDGYFYTQGGRTLIGTGANKDIVFFTGNTTAGHEKAYIYANGDASFLKSVVVNNSITAANIIASIDGSNVVSGTISNARLNAANTTQAGIVQLVDSVANVSITIAPTANAVKTAYDTAISANTRAASAQTAAAAAYSNAIATAATDASTKAATAYTNALSSAASLYLPLAGGTITGNVLMTASNLSVNGAIKFANSTGGSLAYTQYNAATGSIDTFFG